MADDREGYTSSSAAVWETNSEHNDSQGNYGRPSFHSLDVAEEQSGTTTTLRPTLSTSPPPRSSTESTGPHGNVNGTGSVRTYATHQPWRDENTSNLTNTAGTPTLVEPTFDENVLRALCELDCGVPLLLDRIKQSMVSCREASAFFKKRALIEDEYGKSLQKLSRSTSEVYSLNDGKAGSFVSAWQTSLRIHEMMAENRLRFAQRLNEMSDELMNLVKEVDKNRKQTKDLATRYERALQESEGITEKCKNRLDVTSEELERVLLQKEGESTRDTGVRSAASGATGKRAIGKAVAKGGMLLKGKNPGNIARQEDDIRARLSSASDAYRKAVTDTQTMRQEYFNFQLPRILRSLKECADEIDLGTQYHLTRYAFLFESIVLSDGTTLVPGPDDNLGLKSAIETIDNRGDFKTYMQNYAFARGNQAVRGPRREGPADEGFLPPIATIADKIHTPIAASSTNGIYHGHPNAGGAYTPSSVAPSHSQAQNSISVSDKGRPTFGVDLAEQMTRDNVEVPPIVVKCSEAIEKHGTSSVGIYRVNGMTSKVQALKAKLDRDLDSVDLDSPEWSGDINNVSSVLKMWLRELPDPLLTNALHQGFIEAAKIENDRLRHIRLHERVNELPDPNYATLKYFLGHLHRISQHSAENSMTTSNLAIVFGPTLFGQHALAANGQGGGAMADAPFQNIAIETILTHYVDIFIDETE